jgi:hypothetical protein
VALVGAPRDIPNLQIIGACKAGTTSLHHYLSLHPEICMSQPKEPGYLKRPDWDTATDDYLACFARPAKVRGEATASYSEFPRIGDIPRRMHALRPDTRIIYMVRDPLARAESQYQHHVAMREEARSIEEAFADVASERNLYSCCSRYHLQLSQYLEYFDREQILVVDNADLAERREATMREIFAFLDVDPDYTCDEFAARLNTGAGKRGVNDVGAAILTSGVATLSHRLPARLRTPVGDFVRRSFSREVPRVPLPEHVNTALADAIRDDVARLRQFTGRDFAHWSV